VLEPEKPSFRPTKWLRDFRNRKNAKNSKLLENCFELGGIGGWPPIPTWINPPYLGRNCLHYVECSREREKCLSNLHLDELLALMEKLQCLAC
jgi:hypothetical protein